MCACLWLTAHPVKLLAHEVTCACRLCRQVLQALLALLQEIAVVALVAVHTAVVNLNYLVAHIIKEIAVVRHHQQAAAHTREILFEPLHHLKVKVVRRLVKNHQLRLLNEHRSQRHTLLLPARELLHGLVEILYLQLCEHLLSAVLIVPCLQAVHLLHKVLQVAVVTGLNGSLIARNDVSLLAVAPETRLNNSEVVSKVRLLLQVTYAYVIAHGNLATLMRLLARNDLE